jgi:hypothetical protein
MSTNDCPECGRPFARTYDQYIDDVEGVSCGMPVVKIGTSLAVEDCRNETISRLKARVAELEHQLSPRLRIWELSGGDVWCVAHTEDECWGYLEDQHGNTDEIAELKEDGSGWAALPDDKKISLYVDSDGDVCGLDDGAPCNMPCWVWAVRHGAGFLGETE